MALLRMVDFIDNDPGGDGEDGDGVDGEDDSFVMVCGSETGEIVMMLVTGEDHWRR